MTLTPHDSSICFLKPASHEAIVDGVSEATDVGVGATLAAHVQVCVALGFFGVVGGGHGARLEAVVEAGVTDDNRQRQLSLLHDSPVENVQVEVNATTEHEHRLLGIHHDDGEGGVELEADVVAGHARDVGDAQRLLAGRQETTEHVRRLVQDVPTFWKHHQPAVVEGYAVFAATHGDDGDAAVCDDLLVH